ncbi:hypothetical protein [Haloarcula litorea]|uniref:hypothetical protein n=1 Tax=Haloarcula litorea TaxID=3032579 RepID=UPI0023E843D2|nr:hypothetical protein [Halomicroarcula sp. GDY20]
MADAALQHRLDRIERRQRLVLGLLVTAYALAGAWALVSTVPAVTAYHAAVALAGLGLAAAGTAMYRRRAAGS